jgi:exosome complex exonuclease RRP6
MDPAGQFKSMRETIQAALVSTTRSATSLKAGDITFQRSLDPDFSSALDIQNARLLRLAERLLASAATASNVTGPRLPDAEAIDGNWRDVVEVIDSLLEKADTSLDEYTGAVKRLSPAQDQAASTTKPRQAYPKNLPKPQLTFEHVPRNDETGGFKPLLTSKPHAHVPLAKSLETYKDARGLEQYPHPYQKEIESYEYPSSIYEKTEPIQYPPFESTTATWVDTPEALAAMLSELKTAKEIAIDLEHHDNRSYIGLVSLMQISTRNKDWIVDTLKPWRRRLECLNEVFADPAIVKVLHGAYMDIVWLQRDLGLYIVGLFDTFHAARALDYPGASLAFLLKKFVNFDAQKQYQMADWRIRPLSEDMFKYARADTHFLLYVFDCMRNELIDGSDLSKHDQNKIHQVQEKSKVTALQRYEHPIYDVESGLGSAGWHKLLSRTPVTYTPEQFSVFKAVHRWRDEAARLEDESLGYVMPNHAIFSIARSLPEDKPAIFQAVQNVSPVLRMRADELVAVISAARVAGKNGPQLISELERIERLIKASFTQTASAETTSTSKVDASAAAPDVHAQPAVPTVVDQPLRADSSQFWGKLLPLSSQQGVGLPLSSVSLALPLPPLTAEIFSENAVIEKALDVGNTFIVEEDEDEQAQTTDDIFTVRQLGGSRKRKSEAMTNDAVSSPLPLDTPHKVSSGEFDADQIMLATSSKQKTKEQRRSVAEAGGDDYEGDMGENEGPFNYAEATSVLRAQQVDGKQGKEKKRKKGKGNGFSPFAKMSDAPKGLGRSQKEGPGRSKTFTS